MDKYIGFDVDDKKVMACIVQEGKEDLYATIPLCLPDLRQWLRQQRRGRSRVHLTFEVCGASGWLYDGLLESADTLTVSNPSEMTWIYRTAKKTDRIDARKQALLLQMGLIPAVHMPSPEVRQWRGQIQHRRRLMGRSVQCKNQIRSLVKNQGYRQAAHKGSWWSKKNWQWLGELVEMVSEGWSVRLEDLLEQLALFEKQITRITQQLDTRLQQHPGAAVLQDIPGVGPRTAEAVLAYTDEVERFRRGKEYCSYFGMTPRLDQSGSVRREGHISKQGPSVVRWLIVESAWRAIRKSPVLRAFYERVLAGQKKRKKIAIVATARKMLSVMRAMLLTGAVFEERLVLQQEQIRRATQKKQKEKEEQTRRRNTFYH